jgi:hypothetical protein
LLGCYFLLFDFTYTPQVIAAFKRAVTQGKQLGRPRIDAALEAHPGLVARRQRHAEGSPRVRRRQRHRSKQEMGGPFDAAA